MYDTVSELVARLDASSVQGTSIIPWGSPVPSFGNVSRSTVATLGLNPSNLEFVDKSGRELTGRVRRFHTLQSLGLARWRDAKAEHLRMIIDSCNKYFCRNPYDGWFMRLEELISGTKTSYYDSGPSACHLDLIPYATSSKWSELSSTQRTALLSMAEDTLGLLLRDSPVRVLILNGQTVVQSLQQIGDIELERRVMPSWTLPRKTGGGVPGYSYTGRMRKIAGVKLKNEVILLGFNHNIQSSFGVTKGVKAAIGNWITRAVKGSVS